MQEFPATQPDALLNSVCCLRVATESLARAAPLPVDARLRFGREFASSLNELGLMSMNEAQRLIVEFAGKGEVVQGKDCTTAILLLL